jgi:hypothetical protein
VGTVRGVPAAPNLVGGETLSFPELSNALRYATAPKLRN